MQGSTDTSNPRVSYSYPYQILRYARIRVSVDFWRSLTGRYGWGRFAIIFQKKGSVYKFKKYGVKNENLKLWLSGISIRFSLFSSFVLSTTKRNEKKRKNRREEREEEKRKKKKEKEEERQKTYLSTCWL
ncbi:hypothetical protein ACOSQ4_017311 [Xanthoceras sorbifolium]